MDKDILKKAIELADDFELDGVTSQYFGPVGLTSGITQPFLDALAAQLRRQVNATGRHAVHIEPHVVIICSIADDGSHHRVTEYVADDGDETENTITAVVESKVLEKGEGK